MFHRAISKILVAAAFSATGLVTLPAAAAGCGALDISPFGTRTSDCEYVATSWKGVLTYVGVGYNITVFDAGGTQRAFYFCNYAKVCTKRFTFKTFPGGKVAFGAFDGTGRIGDL